MKTTINDVLNNPEAPEWLRAALKAALELPPIIAAVEAEVLAELLSDRVTEWAQGLLTRLDQAGHHCEICTKYDTCNLPIKAPHQPKTAEPIIPLAPVSGTDH